MLRCELVNAGASVVGHVEYGSVVRVLERIGRLRLWIWKKILREASIVLYLSY